MKTHMDHEEIINISTEMEREFEFPMLPPSELELIRHQLSISYDKQIYLLRNQLLNLCKWLLKMKLIEKH